MGINDTQLSTVVSHALRHEPWLYELELDEQGWVDVVDLLSILRYQRSNWKDLTKADLCRMIDVSDKKRHQIEGDRIERFMVTPYQGNYSKRRRVHLNSFTMVQLNPLLNASENRDFYRWIVNMFIFQ